MRIRWEPTRTERPDRWRVFFSSSPQGAWRETFLGLAAQTPEGRALVAVLEGHGLLFTCRDHEDREQLKDELRRCHRLIADLILQTDRQHP